MFVPPRIVAVPLVALTDTIVSVSPSGSLSLLRGLMIWVTFLTAVVPTFEVHCNIPLNHRGAFNKNDISASADVVNLTYGVNFEFNRQSVLTLGFVNPVTSPKPFDLEALVLFNFRFGASRTRPQNLPILGG